MGITAGLPIGYPRDSRKGGNRKGKERAKKVRNINSEKMDKEGKENGIMAFDLFILSALSVRKIALKLLFVTLMIK
jgi:hypothetical protein